MGCLGAMALKAGCRERAQNKIRHQWGKGLVAMILMWLEQEKQNLTDSSKVDHCPAY